MVDDLRPYMRDGTDTLEDAARRKFEIETGDGARLPGI
jgi:hypothetical protein